MTEVKTGGSTARRDHLIAIEEQMSKLWDEQNVYEIDAKDDGRETFFVTFPYPYMNGRLHLGHVYSMTKAEFSARFEQLNGKRVLWPFAFHCTGMPIQAAAQKLEKELYGKPEEEKEKPEPVKAVTGDASEADKVGVFKGKKSKAVAKTGGATQYKIMQDCGVAEDIIPKFVKPEFWLEYFPPYTMADLKRFGVAVDWRRSFITTDMNPFYDKFIQWQFNKLKTDYVKFGKREAIWSIADGQPCADHDRASGEGVCPQEYTLIKLKVQKLTEQLEAICGDAPVYLVAATLRPETMPGQTNCFVLPDGEYGAFLMNDGEVFVCTERSALNMCYQDLGELKDGKAIKLGEFTGKDLLGLPLSAPMAKYDTVHVLPMLTILMNKGTGVVTSVPADSPDDFAALRDWQTRENWRDQYGVKEEWVKGYDIVPIVEIEGSPEYGDASAPYLVEKMKINSHKEKDKLGEAKKEVYLKGFYHGKMITGPQSGMMVKDAKIVARKQLIEANQACRYFEPESEVISRSGDECIVAFCDQWYLNYGSEEWTETVAKHVQNDFNMYNKSAHKAIDHTVGWLGDWACTRTRGLGTRLPWDDKWLIESLSDSTVYMAYYTIAHLLQGGYIYGDKKGPLEISPEDIDDEMFDYVFGLTDSCSSKIAQDKCDQMRKEFLYWYPMNLRCSGKDLIQNHLTMCLFNHAAIWKDKPEMMPKSFFTNGHVKVDDVKMSKSKGNFFTCKDSCDKFSADGTRLACAVSGDTLEDANFSTEVANQSILRLYTFEQWARENLGKGRTGPKNFLDQVFDNEMTRLVAGAKEGYASMTFRDAVRYAWYEFQNLKDEYRELNEEVHVDCIQKFLEVQALILSPICPHFCEHLWTNVLGKKTLVVRSSWPELPELDEVLARKYAIMQGALRQFRLDRDKAMGKKKDIIPKHAVVYVAKEYQDWQQAVLKLLHDTVEIDEDNCPVRKDFMKAVKDAPEVSSLPKDIQKKALPFASFMVSTVVKGVGKQGLELALPFDEQALLSEVKHIILKQLNIEDVEIVYSTEQHASDSTEKRLAATPGKPQMILWA